jgi:hypothetical protein
MNNKFFEIFYECGLFFKDSMEYGPLKRYPDFSTNVWDSMGFIIPGSFEHQGTNRLFHIIALESLEYCKEQRKNFDENVSQMMWDDFNQRMNEWRNFKQKTDSYKLNIGRNPLAPKGSGWTDKNNKVNTTNKCSISEFIYENNAKGYGIVDLLSNVIKNKELGINHAHSLLMSINGVGTKIASMILRDIVVLNKIDVTEDKKRYLLQPIDKWVEMVVDSLSGKIMKNITDRQQWIIKNCGENFKPGDFKPEIIAMGIWYYCSVVVEHEYVLEKALKNFEYGIALLEEHKNVIRGKCRTMD